MDGLFQNPEKLDEEAKNAISCLFPVWYCYYLAD